MDFLTVGGDARFAWMAKLAGAYGLTAAALGAEKADIPGLRRAGMADVGEAQMLVMPNPFGPDGLKQPLSDDNIDPETLLTLAAPGTPIALFGPGSVPQEVRTCHPILDLTDEEELAQDLARQTAEGAVHAACERMEYELYGANVMILGYGRIARALHRILNGYGACVTVAARRLEIRKQAKQMGARAVDFKEAEELLRRQNVIFSTPAQRVMDARRVAMVSRDALLIDLSGRPYGVDLEAAHQYYVNAWREPGLPGRYCPRSSAKAMINALFRLKGVNVNE